MLKAPSSPNQPTYSVRRQCRFVGHPVDMPITDSDRCWSSLATTSMWWCWTPVNDSVKHRITTYPADGFGPRFHFLSLFQKSHIRMSDVLVDSRCKMNSRVSVNLQFQKSLNFIKTSVYMTNYQGCRGDGISIPIPTPYPWGSPYQYPRGSQYPYQRGSQYPRQTCKLQH